MWFRSGVSPGPGGMLPTRCGISRALRSRMCTTTLTFLSCNFFSTSLGSLAKTFGLNSNDGCGLFQPVGVKPVPRYTTESTGSCFLRKVSTTSRISCSGVSLASRSSRCDCMYPSAHLGGIAGAPVRSRRSFIIWAGSAASKTKMSMPWASAGTGCLPPSGGAGLSTPAFGVTLLVGMKVPLAGSRKSTCTQGDATNKPQPSVPTRTATGLREPSVAEPQPRRVADVERDGPRLLVEHQFLDFTPGGALDEDSQRRGGDFDVQRADAGLHRPLDLAQADRR